MDKVIINGSKWWKRLLSFIGPAYLISIGYMDPGNWATDIEGGSKFGYTLIWVLLMSNIMAMILQTLSARLGIITGYDLAQGCRKEYPKPVRLTLWVLAEIAIAATDLAEVLGTILGLNLLFGIPLLAGCIITAFDTFLLLAIQRLGVRRMEAFILMLIGVIASCFIIELFLVSPDWGMTAKGFVPDLPGGALFIAIGIIGATVMPHNLYLHSSLVQSREINPTFYGKKEACQYNLIDTMLSLNAAFFVNAAILILSAATFFKNGIVVTQISQAHNLLSPILGTTIAPACFAIALLAAGQSSTLTGTISGQVVMEGFLNFKMRPWLRRLITRTIALVPAVIVIAISGDKGTYQLLILSQVLLSLQLPFAIVPLIQFTSDKRKMGVFANKPWLKIIAWIIASIIIFLNIQLLMSSLKEYIKDLPTILFIIIALAIVFAFIILAYIIIYPFIKKEGWEMGKSAKAEIVADQLIRRKITKIGAALENGAGDAEIISMAISLSNPDVNEIALIHISESPGSLVYGKSSDSQHHRQDEEYLNDLAGQIKISGIPITTYLNTGDPVQEIINAVKVLKLDMLVLGAHGHHGLGDIIFGETVEGVRHNLDIPVVIVKLKEVGREKPLLENKQKK